MSERKHAAEIFILQDPVQDYEESITILGVYGSLDAAKQALPRLRQKGYPGPYWGNEWRESQVEHWRGDEMVASWTYSPQTGWRADHA